LAVRTTLVVSQCIQFKERANSAALALLPLANQLAVRPIRYVAELEAAKLWIFSCGRRGMPRNL
jgi:hypothetical protein